MKIMLVGAGGMLATELVKQWSARHEMHPLSIADLDITRFPGVRQAVRSLKPGIIVNCAAYNAVDDAETQIEEAYRANCVGPRNLAVCAEEANVPLVHFSTDYVFDGRVTRPYVEYDAPNPLGVYGKSKAAGERAVRDHSSRWFIVRLAWLVGHAGRNFVETMLHVGKEKGSVAVVTDQVGCPTFCADVARNLELLIASGEFGLYHMTGNGECSWHEFAMEIFRQAGMPHVRVEETTMAAYGRPAPRPAYAVLRNLMLELGVGDLMPFWKESLREYLAGRNSP